MSEQLKEKIKNGQLVTGCFVNFYAPVVVEMMKSTGFDFLILDQEHGCFDRADMENMIRAADIIGLDAVVRVDYDPSSIQKALDMGAAGVQIPMIRTKEDAVAAVSRAKYPPQGSRGVDFYSRAYRLRDTKNGADYLSKQNEDTLVIVQIETAEAVRNFEEIVSVPGVDIAFLGTLDLSVSMGYPEGAKAPHMQSVLNDISRRAGVMQVPTGMVFLNQPMFEDASAKGVRFLAATIMRSISAGFEQIMGSAKL
jgi:4-hydroxy-2-oxoheptanedioate aldolase